MTNQLDKTYPLEKIFSSQKPARLSDSSNSQTIGFLCFILNDEEYGIELNYIKQIVKLPPITWVPRVKPHILGIIPIRGTGVTLIDTKRIMGLPNDEQTFKTAKVLLIEMDDEQIGLIVDAVSHVRRIPYDYFEENPILDDSHRAECIVGIARPSETEQITILDLKDVLMETLR